QTAFELSSTSLSPLHPAPGCQRVSQDAMFSFTACLSYIHGNQPVQSQRPVGLESNKTQTEPTMNQLLKCRRGGGVRRARSNPRETV
ncbi:unnamed protein product, partial [Pleuronectes platessa]